MSDAPKNLGINIDVEIDTTKAETALSKFASDKMIKLSFDLSDLNSLDIQSKIGDLTALKLDFQLGEEVDKELDATLKRVKSIHDYAQKAKEHFEGIKVPNVLTKQQNRRYKQEDQNYALALEAGKQVVRLETQVSQLKGESRKEAELALEKAKQNLEAARGLLTAKNAILKLDTEINNARAKEADYAKMIAAQEKTDKFNNSATELNRQAKLEEQNYKIALEAGKKLITLEEQANRLKGEEQKKALEMVELARKAAMESSSQLKTDESKVRLQNELNNHKLQSIDFENKIIAQMKEESKQEEDQAWYEQERVKRQKELYKDLKRYTNEIATVERQIASRPADTKGNVERQATVSYLERQRDLVLETMQAEKMLTERMKEELNIIETIQGLRIDNTAADAADKAAAKQEKKNKAYQREVSIKDELIRRYQKEYDLTVKRMRTGRNKDFLDANAMIDMDNALRKLKFTASSLSLDDVKKEITNIRFGLRNIGVEANAARQNASTAMTSLADSFRNLTRYVTGAMLIRKFFTALRNGINDVKELNETITTLKITMQELSDRTIKGLIDSSKKLSRELKANITDVLNAVRTIANAQESVDTILNKMKPALIINNLTGLGADSSIDVIQGVLYQFDALKDQSAESAMAVADAMVSISKSLGMDFSAGVQGMSESVSILGSLSNELGMSMEETLSTIAAISETTRLSMSEVATGLKTIMSRVMRVADGDTSSEEMLKAQKALESINVSVRNKFTGEMRDFGDIIADLASKYDSLGKKERDYVNDALGGARQVSLVIAMTQSYTRQQELLQEALNGTGAALTAQEEWSQSLSAKYQDLSNAVSIFWQTLIESDFIIGIVDGLTTVMDGLTALTEKLGSVPVTIGGATLAVLTFNKGIRSLVLSTAQSLIPSFGRLMTSYDTQKIKLEQHIAKNRQLIQEKEHLIATLMTQKEAMRANGENLRSITGKINGQKAALNGLTAETDRTEASLNGLNRTAAITKTVMSIGLTAAITLVATAISKLIADIKGAKEQMREFNQAIVDFNKNKDDIELEAKNIESYYKLTKELEKLTEGSEEYLKKQEEINQLVSDLESADGRYLQILKDENMQLEEQYNLLKYVNSARTGENASETGESLMKNPWYDSTRLWRQENNAKNTYDDYMLAQSGYLRAIEIKEQAEEEAYQKALANNQSLAEAEQARFEAGLAYENNINSRREYLDELEEKLRQLILFFENHNKIIDEIEADGGTVTGTRRLELPEVLKNIKAELFNATSATKNNTDALDQNAKAAETDAEKQERLAREAQEARENFVESTKTLEDLNELLEDVNTHGVTLDMLDNDLLENFTGNLANAAEVQAYLKQKIEETKKSQETAYTEMMKNDENFYQTQVKNSDSFNTYKKNLENALLKYITELRNKGLKAEAEALNKKLQMAKDDLDNAKTLAEARAKIEEGLIQGMQKGWSEYYQMSHTQMRENLEFYYANKEEMDKRNPGYAQLAKEMEAYLASYTTLIEIASNPITVKPPTFSSVSSSTSSSSSSNSNTVENLDLEIDRYHDLERAITRVNNALEENKTAQTYANPTQKIKLMKQEISLYKELQKAQQNLIKEEEKELAELKKKLSANGFKFNADGTVSNYIKRLQELEKLANKSRGTAKQAKIEEVKALKEVVDRYEELINEILPDARNEYKELNNTIKDLAKEQLEYVADLQSQITDALKEELEKRNDAVKNALEKEKELYESQYEEENWQDEFNQEQRKLAEIQAQIDSLSRDFSEAGRLKLEQLMTEYREQQEVIDQMLKDKAHEDGSSRFDEAIDELDKELDDLLSPESLAQMVSDALEKGFISLNGEVIKTENLLTNMLKNSGDLFLATGKLIQTELIDGLKVAQGLMKDISSLNATVLGSSARSLPSVATYSATPQVASRSIDTTSVKSATPSVTVTFDQLLNVEGNLDTTLMLDLENKLNQAMNKVTHSITQALSYR